MPKDPQQKELGSRAGTDPVPEFGLLPPPVKTGNAGLDGPKGRLSRQPQQGSLPRSWGAEHLLLRAAMRWVQVQYGAARLSQSTSP